ncbi:AlpA family phage regulatory protein [Shewanella litorisediminis]|uniref:AlpA family phage regulatory protein n=1 Tax=Shewanella litorisediminis TaxID=1173586 RepID=A0ABX7G2G2_9GAMM|nr:AlpA family phage regulatory protein [Shewanella litorisediminis]MCL2918608.1 AlpA family transcriptional regulator [Shewanella litorisediminis]QRH01432.1 AlpA family phage regulatory protein [Shewanella litorisediminis]
MDTSFFTPESEPNDIVINEQQRRFITSVSRAQAFQLEREGRFPKRIKLNAHTNGWKLSEIVAWLRACPVVDLKHLEGNQ